MTRRDVNSAILSAATTAGAAQFFGGWLQAAQAHTGNHSAPPDPHDWDAYQPKFFQADQFKMLARFSEIVIPTDDTPGAREAHVAAFIDFVVNAAAEYAPEMQTDWRKAMIWLQGQGFGQMAEQPQTELVTAMSKKGHAGFASFQLIRDMTIHAFYTSRAGLVDVLEYKGIAYLAEFPACQHPEHQEI